MTILAAPNTVTLAMTRPGLYVTVICAGATDVMQVAWSGPGGVSGLRVMRNTVAAGDEVGPFADNTIVVLTALSGMPDYDAPMPINVAANDSATSMTAAQLAGTKALLSGGGIPLAAIDATTLIFGDSHSRRNGPTLSSKSSTLIGYELADAVTGGAQVYFGGDGYFVVANTILNGAFRIIHNASVGGETIAQVNARIDTAMLKYKPRFATYMAGTNDIQDSGIVSIAAADAAAASATAGIAAGWAKIRSAGALVLAYTITPRTGLNGFQRRAWSQVNSWIRQNVGKTVGVYLAGDAAKAAGNPATGDWLASGEYGAVATANADNIHATQYGYYLIGCESAGRLAALLPAIKRQSLNSPELAYDVTNGNNPFGNLLSNGKLLGTGGTQTAPATGAVASNWTVQATPTAPTGGTIVTSKVARGIVADDATQVEEFGEWQQVSMTGGSTAGVLALQQEIQGLSGGAWAIGDVVSAAVQFETDATNWGQSGVGAYAPIVEIQLGPNAGVGLGGYQLNGPPAIAGRIPAGVARTPEVVIPAGLTRIFIRVLFRGQGTWRVSNIDFRRVPDRTASLV